VTAFVLRRSLLSVTVLVALLTAAGVVCVEVLGTSPWVPLVVSLAFVALQYVVNPWIIAWLIPATELRRTADGYATDHVVGELVHSRCLQAGLRPVRLGIVEDGSPNAFTFGRTRRDARVYVSRGLLDRLDEDELDAVITHELGHVRNNDFIVMTVAAVVPMLLYYVYVIARSNSRQESVPVALAAFLGYLASQLVVLALGRARELGADHYSCSATGNGNALSSALVKIAYGMGEVQLEHERAIRELREDADRSDKKEIARRERKAHRRASVSVLGIADPRTGAAVALATQNGLDEREVVGAMQWEACNPWARWAEKLSSHPIVLHRIASLERSGLPGAPTGWNASGLGASCQGPEVSHARRLFPVEFLIRYGYWVPVVVALLAWASDDWVRLGQALIAAGVLLFVRYALRHAPFSHEPVDRVTSLLSRLDASPARGLPVSLRGRVLGRGMPGYVLSPDLVVQDDSGFVTVLYSQPLPFARAWFGLVKAERYVGQEVLVTGWYRREPGPLLELRSIVAADGTRTRSWQWMFNFTMAVVLTLIGFAVLALAG
jgi:Zn-dependent protease with chaperone function